MEILRGAYYRPSTIKEKAKWPAAGKKRFAEDRGPTRGGGKLRRGERERGSDSQKNGNADSRNDSEAEDDESLDETIRGVERAELSRSHGFFVCSLVGRRAREQCGENAWPTEKNSAGP